MGCDSDFSCDLNSIATGQIGFNDLWAALRPLLVGLQSAWAFAVAILSKYGVNQLSAVPQVTVALVLGTIIGVVAFKGCCRSVIASGMTYCIVTLLDLRFK